MPRGYRGVCGAIWLINANVGRRALQDNSRGRMPQLLGTNAARVLGHNGRSMNSPVAGIPFCRQVAWLVTQRKFQPQPEDMGTGNKRLGIGASLEESLFGHFSLIQIADLLIILEVFY